MSFYLSCRKLDVRSGDGNTVVINETDALENGLNIGDKLAIDIAGNKQPIIVSLDTSDSLINEGEIGFYEDFWEKHKIRFGTVVKIDLAPQSEAVVSIRKKLLGGTLSYEEIYRIIADIASDKLDRILTAYYISAGYSPGFNEQEMLYMTKALAETGNSLHFEGIVADKHSIGGVAGKGITPIVIPIIATYSDIMVPNTSTRSVTTSSATTDMLEVIMPMIFSKETLEAMLLKTNAVMVWGGGVDLAPADDKIIQLQKLLGIESIDKFVASIVAKKVAQGVNHVVIDVPVGKGAKIETLEAFTKVEGAFNRVCAKFQIKVKVHKRDVKGLDGNAVGPALECKEFLKVFERDTRRSPQLEEDALRIAGDLIELCGKEPLGKGYDTAKALLENGKAFAKLKQIIKIQGGNPEVSSNNLEIGGISWEFPSDSMGTITHIDNKSIFDVCKALGNPKIKEAGIYFSKRVGDIVKIGEKLATLYATTENRMALAQEIIKKVKIFTIE